MITKRSVPLLSSLLSVLDAATVAVVVSVGCAAAPGCPGCVAAVVPSSCLGVRSDPAILAPLLSLASISPLRTLPLALIMGMSAVPEVARRVGAALVWHSATNSVAMRAPARLRSSNSSANRISPNNAADNYAIPDSHATLPSETTNVTYTLPETRESPTAAADHYSLPDSHTTHETPYGVVGRIDSSEQHLGRKLITHISLPPLTSETMNATYTLPETREPPTAAADRYSLPDSHTTHETPYGVVGRIDSSEQHLGRKLITHISLPPRTREQHDGNAVEAAVPCPYGTSPLLTHTRGLPTPKIWLPGLNTWCMAQLW